MLLFRYYLNGLAEVFLWYQFSLHIKDLDLEFPPGKLLLKIQMFIKAGLDAHIVSCVFENKMPAVLVQIILRLQR